MTKRNALVAVCASASLSGCTQTLDLGVAREACFTAIKVAANQTVSPNGFQVRLESPEKLAKGSGVTFMIKSSEGGDDFVCAVNDHKISQLSRGPTDLLSLVPEKLRAI